MTGNLITNATRYTAKGEVIAVSRYWEGSMTVVAVSDTGMRIASNELSDIFKRTVLINAITA